MRHSIACLGLAIAAFSSGCSTGTPSGQPSNSSGGAPGGCPSGTVSCNGQCINLQADPLHCGSCATACSGLQSCTQGACSCVTPLSACGSACVNQSADGNNCGACGKVCGAGLVCSQGSCSSTCAATELKCGTSCVNAQTDPTNCGTCGHACSGGQTCAAGTCVCGAGQQSCSGTCTDVATSFANCGSCGHACGMGQTCSAGQCVGSSGTGGSSGSGGAPGTGGSGGVTTGTGGSGGVTSGTGGSGGVTTGTGGSGGVTSGTGGSGGVTTGTGGSAGAAGGPGTATALSCSDPVYGSVSIPAANVISDFERGSLFQYVQAGRGAGAEPWYAYAVDDVNDSHGEVMTPSIVNPKNAANHFAIDTAVHGPCSSKGALRVSSPGKAGSGSYAGFGIDFMARTAARKKQSYNGSAYTGVGFWAKCAADLQFAFFKAPDAAQDADMEPPPCSYSANTCNQYGIKNAVITKDWTYYKLYFSELLQDPNGKNFGTAVDKSKLTAFQIHVNPLSPRSGSPAANPFDCYIDDVHFLTEAAPTAPTTAVTYTTSGNKILRNGSQYKIRGLVRPSMEWDYAGFGITREDLQRMKSWHANAIRLAVSDKLWNGGSTGSATGDGAAYQRNVKRAVSWILQQGMDVILDLHYVAGMPTAENATFWNNVSKDAFFKDGRIIFELYNEPTGDFTQLQAWMQSTTQTIRGNGANNLILVGGVDYSYDISGYVGKPVTGGAIAYVTHPYIFKTSPGDQVAFLTPATTLPVVATEFGDANVEGFHTIPPTQCDAGIYSTYITKFEGAGMSWTSWAWIVDQWGCGFPQLITDYSGTPNTIGTPVRQQLMSLNP